MSVWTTLSTKFFALNLELVKTCILGSPMASMKMLSLRKSSKIYFFGLEKFSKKSIFGRIWGVWMALEGWIESERRGSSSTRFNIDPKSPKMTKSQLFQKSQKSLKKPKKSLKKHKKHPKSSSPTPHPPQNPFFTLFREWYSSTWISNFWAIFFTTFGSSPSRRLMW